MSAELARLFDKYLGAGWLERHDDPGAVGRGARDS